MVSLMGDGPIPAHFTERRLDPLFHPEMFAPPKASMLELQQVDPIVAVRFVRAWHSRLATCQSGPWMLAYVMHYEQCVFGAALWHNPSARTLPQDWLELRRMVVADDAPPHAASWMLGKMRKVIRTGYPHIVKLISYQDEEVHTGTIYRAAGWDPAWRTKPRQRDRTPHRVGTHRAYRSDVNGAAAARAGKTRWEIAP